MPVSTQKLSRQQKAILLAIYERYETDPGSAALPAWGIPWHPRRAFNDPAALALPAYGYFKRDHLSPTAQASLSRALRRLEARGLVQRKNCISDGHHTTSVRLLPPGLAVLQATGAVGPEVSPEVAKAIATTQADLDANFARFLAEGGRL
jgi:DNA-binding MarR family transcriptional regulator